MAVNDVKVKESWHLSKSVPIALIIALIVQSAGFIAFGALQVGEFKNQLSQVERRVQSLEAENAQSREIFQRVARIEATQALILDGLSDIKDELRENRHGP